MKKLTLIVVAWFALGRFCSAQALPRYILQKALTEPTQQDNLPGCPTPGNEPVREGVYKVGKGVKPPLVTYMPEASYSKEGRDKKIAGNSVIGLTVDANGMPQDLCLLKSLGYGLDQQAALAVRQYRFKPATRDGQPVAVRINVMVHFRL